MMLSQENEFGNKNDLETGPKWAQFGLNYFFGYNDHQFLLDIIEIQGQSRQIPNGDKKDLYFYRFQG